jgi:mRNA interferase RelE/StbE
MKLEFDRSFSKSLEKIHDKNIKQRIETVIEMCEGTNSINTIRNVKKMSGFQNYYRIRIGDYRIGIELLDNFTIKFIIVAHRKDIYNIFP